MNIRKLLGRPTLVAPSQKHIKQQIKTHPNLTLTKQIILSDLIAYLDSTTCFTSPKRLVAAAKIVEHLDDHDINFMFTVIEETKDIKGLSHFRDYLLPTTLILFVKNVIGTLELGLLLFGVGSLGQNSLIGSVLSVSLCFALDSLEKYLTHGIQKRNFLFIDPQLKIEKDAKSLTLKKFRKTIDQTSLYLLAKKAENIAENIKLVGNSHTRFFAHLIKEHLNQQEVTIAPKRLQR